jgi:hypothetical protein
MMAAMRRRSDLPPLEGGEDPWQPLATLWVPELAALQGGVTDVFPPVESPQLPLRSLTRILTFTQTTSPRMALAKGIAPLHSPAAAQPLNWVR